MTCHHTQSTRCIAAYALVIQPKSTVRLYKRRMSQQVGHRHLGFGVRAAQKIHKGDYIYELSGMLATDNDTPHTRLSETIPFGGASQDQRVLFGPIRFVNHRCVHFNAEVSFYIRFCQPLSR
jgi:hypothetical protein